MSQDKTMYRIDLYLNRMGLEPLLIGGFEEYSHSNPQTAAVEFAKGYVCGMLGWTYGDLYLQRDNHTNKSSNKQQEWDIVYKGNYHPSISFTTKLIFSEMEVI